MSNVRLHWFLPSAGDSRTVIPFGPDGHSRPPTIDYIAQIAQAADRLGFEGVLTPTGTWCEDSWVVTAALLRETERLKFIVAFRPNSLSPTLAAQKASTFQRISDGRLMVNIVTGGDAAEQRRFGDWLEHDERYDRTNEFLSVFRGALSGRPFDWNGRYFHVEGATVGRSPDVDVPILFGGASEAAELVAAEHADIHLAWGESPLDMAPSIERLRKRARERGRNLEFGVRLHVITRDRSSDAWAETDQFIESLDPQVVEQAQRAMKKSSSVGQQRMLALHGGSTDRLVIHPNLWAGYGLVRGGAGSTPPDRDATVRRGPRLRSGGRSTVRTRSDAASARRRRSSRRRGTACPTARSGPTERARPPGEPIPDPRRIR